MEPIVHIPVMMNEVLAYLAPAPGGDFIDGTVGQGGHASRILERTSPEGRLLGVDRDPRNLETAKHRLKSFGDRAVLVHDTYANARRHAKAQGFKSVEGVLLDLGFSSAHIEDATRGFSFQSAGPLDMRYDPTQALTAETIVNDWSEQELSTVFRRYGEEPDARRIAKAIFQARKKDRILTTTQLAEVVVETIPRRGKIHPATRVFQALRIAVNDELGELERGLSELVDLLKPGGRLVVISFQSLEDRIVKQFFKQHEQDTLTILTKRVVLPSEEEIRANPRARSAKLRVAEKR